MANKVTLDASDNEYTLERGITRDQSGKIVTGVSSRGGNDTLNLYASDGTTQIHAWGGAGRDVLNLSFGRETGGTITQSSHGHHVRGDFDGGRSRGRDTFNFIDVDRVDNTIVGRIEDYDHSRDILMIEGTPIDKTRMEQFGHGTTNGWDWKIVEWAGDQLGETQQWLLIDTDGGWIFYALEGHV